MFVVRGPLSVAETGINRFQQRATDNGQFDMAKIDFHRNERPTVGIELELGLVDAHSMALTSAYGLLNARLIADGHQDDECGNFKPEFVSNP